MFNKQSQAVKAKKHLGQHFLNDEPTAIQIVDALASKLTTRHVLEIGPGMGVLTKYLLEKPDLLLSAIEVDKESIRWLNEHFPQLNERLIEGDFLSLNLQESFPDKVSIIGNFPYNISSQIVFRIIENREYVPLMVGMFQKEVGERIGAVPGNKDYGIMSVLTQAFYHVEYLFTVPEHVFTPPPKVKSGVIRMTRRESDYEVSEKDLFSTVKTAFNQRRKKLRNALSSFQVDDALLEEHQYINKRAEELSVKEFVHLANLIRLHGKNQRG